jgi:hypothetical protein
MKDALKLLNVMALLLPIGLAQADPIKDNLLYNYTAVWVPNAYKERLMACPDTCKLRVQGEAEHERSMVRRNSNITNVCKFGERLETDKPIRDEGFLYGNQFDNKAVCYVTDMNGKSRKSEEFYCLCIAESSRLPAK